MILGQVIEILQRFFKIGFPLEESSETALDMDKRRKRRFPSHGNVGFHEIQEADCKSPSGYVPYFLSHRVP
jgi:hypothetical protein